MDVSTCIKVRHGRRYHLLLVYEDEAEVRRQLECFDWKHMAEASKAAMSAEDKADFDYHKVSPRPYTVSLLRQRAL